MKLKDPRAGKVKSKQLIVISDQLGRIILVAPGDRHTGRHHGARRIKTTGLDQDFIDWGPAKWPVKATADGVWRTSRKTDYHRDNQPRQSHRLQFSSPSHSGHLPCSPKRTGHVLCGTTYKCSPKQGAFQLFTGCFPAKCRVFITGERESC